MIKNHRHHTKSCNYEIGRSKIYDEMLSRIADALDVTPDTLLGFRKSE